MPTFTYEGLNREGKEIKGVKESPSKTTLLMELKNAGLLVSDISEISAKRKLTSYFPFIGKKKQLPDIFFQIALLLKSGIPLVESLKVVADSIPGEGMKKFLLDLSASVSEGIRFSAALEKYKGTIVDEVYINLIRVSENIGRLADVLLDIVVYEEEKRKPLIRLDLLWSIH